MCPGTHRGPGTDARPGPSEDPKPEAQGRSDPRRGVYGLGAHQQRVDDLLLPIEHTEGRSMARDTVQRALSAETLLWLPRRQEDWV